MRQIWLHSLVGNTAALVDDADYEWLSGFTWYRVEGHGHVYAGRSEPYDLPDGKRAWRGREMQQDILYPGQFCPKGMKADFIDQNTLNNQRHNLRLVSDHISNVNRRVFRSNTSGYRGVWEDTRDGSNSWRASLMAYGQRHHYTRCATPEEAAAAYNSLARAYHGDNAQLNVLPEGYPEFLDDALAPRVGRRRQK